MGTFEVGQKVRITTNHRVANGKEGVITEIDPAMPDDMIYIVDFPGKTPGYIWNFAEDELELIEAEKVPVVSVPETAVELPNVEAFEAQQSAILPDTGVTQDSIDYWPKMFHERATAAHWDDYYNAQAKNDMLDILDVVAALNQQLQQLQSELDRVKAALLECTLQMDRHGIADDWETVTDEYVEAINRGKQALQSDEGGA